MITEATIRRLEEKTEAYRKDYVRRLGPGLSPQYLDARLQGFYDGSYGTEEIHQKEMQHQLQIEERKKGKKK